MKSLCRLLLAGCDQNRVSQPVWSGFAGSADCGTDCLGLLRRQSNGKDSNRDAFCREAGSAHFLSHSKLAFRVRKCLTLSSTFVYKRQVSNETELSSERMAGAAAGESELT